MPAVPFRELLRVFVRIGLLSFGGPAGQIAVMHRILVEEKRWIGEHRFLHALNYCMLLPGPEAQQLCTYCGWLLRGTWGGIIAGLLFVLPGFLAILACSLIYILWGDVAWVAAAFDGLKPAVIGLVVAALVRVGSRALRHRAQWLLAAAAFLALTCGAPYPAVIALAALIGLGASSRRPSWFPATGHKAAADMPEPVIPEDALTRGDPGWRRAVGQFLIWSLAWLVPIAALHLLGGSHILPQIGRFFSQVAVVTFGGAYAVLPYIAEHTVNDLGWISPSEMITGLGLAETTPGPLIMVVQFVAFLAAHHRPEGLDPLMAGLLASLVATWATFMPSYLWIFVGAPQVERLRHHAGLSAMLAAITAAVVGVILTLTVWFSVQVVFTRMESVEWFGVEVSLPDWASLDPVAAILSLAACVALIRFRLGLGWVLGGSVLIGGSYRLLCG